MNYLDLFSGIGGFALGAYWSGFRCENHFFSEIEPYAVKLYQQRFPEAIALGDITKINGLELKEKYGTEWIITGGFPCQDISVAGNRAGITGKRSSLWFEMWRIISEIRPKYAIMENVGMLTRSGLGEVLRCLAEIGYDAEWQDIRASDMGAPHKRERIWIISYPSKSGFNTRKSNETGNLEREQSENIQQSGNRRPGQIGRNDKISSTYPDKTSWINVVQQKRCNSFNEEREERFGSFNWSKFEMESGASAILQRWTSLICESPLVRMDDGIPDIVDRLSGCGNAIVPQIAELLFRAILETESKL